ncbi:aldo/keto reductase [Jiangella asiatica]|uniref:Aldo/keto reductase n=1 Tax=Jiangella asiatica TaxID=2530372 RepID=A0A4R5DG63_9ACTN|nr:aldo/keto reductase [Jiangella asiatica]TDE09675.1 aldo/keto reductase [Jiangella asiatica]
MSTTEHRHLGSTGLSVPPVCVGTSALGSFPAQYGYDVDERTAIDTILAALDSEFTFIDTSNEYGGGDSERRIGRAIAERGGLPSGALVATKVDPLPRTTDFSGARVRRSVDESIERLGLDTLPLVYLHDPEKISFDEATGPGGAVEAMLDLRAQGVIEHLGVAGGPIELELAYLRTGFFDVVLSHNRWTLVDSSADELIDECAARGVGFVNAAPFGGGMLARGPAAVPTYCYAPAAPDVLGRVEAIESLCRDHDVPLAAAALQFSTRDARVASTIVGMSRPDRPEQTRQLLGVSVPDELWAALDPLIKPGRAGIQTGSSSREV